ncbi:hypothetical protein NKI09_05115 [Mesorhizobium sp. M0757]
MNIIDSADAIQGHKLEASTDRGYFWLTGEQFAKLKQPLPTDTRGKARLD